MDIYEIATELAAIGEAKLKAEGFDANALMVIAGRAIGEESAFRFRGGADDATFAYHLTAALVAFYRDHADGPTLDGLLEQVSSVYGLHEEQRERGMVRKRHGGGNQ